MDYTYLFAALLWGSVGLGFFIYGKKQRSMIPLIGGILLMAVSYAFRTPLSLSLVSLAIIAGVYVMRGR